MIAIVNYGMGNLGSITNMLDRLGHPSVVTSEADTLRSADALILPGVGAFDRGMLQLESLGLREPLDDLVLGRRVPVLGICLGMQLLARRSDEGVRTGLGWIAADVIKFDGATTRVPHMGWNVVRPTSRPAALFDDRENRFYFVHSYHLSCDDESTVAGWTHHGIDFPAAVVNDNVLGVQFHPEKSHRFGMALLDRFASRALARER